MDTITKRTRTRLSPEKRKQQLLDFALEVFARRGIGRAGHADIADMANVSVATVFNYFHTREDLVEQVLKQVETCFSAMLTQCLAEPVPTVEAQLKGITHQLVDTVIEQQDWLKVWYEWSASMRSETWPQFLKDNNKSFDTLKSLLEKGLEQNEFNTTFGANDLTWLLHGLCYVLYAQANINPDREKMHDQVDKYLAILLA